MSRLIDPFETLKSPLSPEDQARATPDPFDTELCKPIYNTLGSPRDSWDVYYLKLAETASTRGTCDRAKMGCVLVASNSILSTGYNGAIAGLENCDDIGHLMDNNHCVRTVHAEQNAIAQAARLGKATAGATAYINAFPCWICFRLLANSGIKRVVYSKSYRDDPNVLDAAKKASIELVQIVVE